MRNGIKVTSITVTGAGNVTTTTAGALQMSAAVLPEEATNKVVTWSVTSAAGITISANGLLEATKSTAVTVTVTATAKDDSGITGTKEITISKENQED